MFRIYLFMVLIALVVACKPYNTKVNQTPLPEIKTYFSATIDGRKVLYKADSVGYLDTSFVFSEVFPDSSFNSYISGLEKPGRLRIELIRKRLAHVGVAPSQFDFRNYFLIGNYSFAYSPPTYINNGFTIAFSEGGIEYTTEGVNAFQTPGSFRIVAQEDGMNSKGQYQVNILCRFNCNFYARTDFSNVKTVTNAEYRGSFIYQQ